MEGSNNDKPSFIDVRRQEEDCREDVDDVEEPLKKQTTTIETTMPTSTDNHCTKERSGGGMIPDNAENNEAKLTTPEVDASNDKLSKEGGESSKRKQLSPRCSIKNKRRTIQGDSDGSEDRLDAPTGNAEILEKPEMLETTKEKADDFATSNENTSEDNDLIDNDSDLVIVAVVAPPEKNIQREIINLADSDDDDDIKNPQAESNDHQDDDTDGNDSDVVIVPPPPEPPREVVDLADSVSDGGEGESKPEARLVGRSQGDYKSSDEIDTENSCKDSDGG